MINEKKKIFISISIALMLLSIFLVLFNPPKGSPEFTGSAVLEVNFNNNIEKENLDQLLIDFEGVSSKKDENYVIETKALNDKDYIKITNTIEDSIGTFSIIKFESFSPIISEELKRKSLIAIIVAALIIIAYISYAFRNVSRPVESYKYGAVSTVALLHDALIPLGMFAIISPFTSATIDTLFVTAILATLGYSINDTIVIFDRVREVLEDNKAKNIKQSFEEVVDIGVKRSFRRSVFTSLSTMLPLLLLYIFVPVTQWFAFTLFVGIVAGTYSSLFFAPSLLLYWHQKFPQDQSGMDKDKSDIEKAEEKLLETLKGSSTI